MTFPVTLHSRSLKSRSALQAFTECQYRWDQIYRQGVEDSSDEARRGSTFHECAKRYIDLLFAVRESDNIQLAADALREGIAAMPCPAHLLTDVTDLFWRWAEGFKLDTDAYLLSEEHPPDPDGYKLRIDLAYAKGDTIEMPDWKTHWNIRSAAQVREDFQAKFYAARARRIWPGFRVYRFVMVFVRFNVAVPVEFVNADLDAIDLQVDAIEQAQAQTLARTSVAFQPTPGDHCGYCHLACPMVDDDRLDPVRAVTREEAVRIAGEYLALSQAVQARRAALSTYTAVSGPLDVGGVQFGHFPQERRRFSAAGVVDALRNVGVAPIFTVGTSAIKSFLTAKKWSHVRPDLEELAVTTTKTQFSTKRAAPQPEADQPNDDEE